MMHLETTTLARLIDEPPQPAEALHLASCAECRAELDALREQIAALRALGPLPPRPGAWDTLETLLRRERLIRPRRPWLAPTLRAAAALVLVLGGAALALRGEWRSPAVLPPVQVSQRPASAPETPTAPPLQPTTGPRAADASGAALAAAPPQGGAEPDRAGVAESMEPASPAADVVEQLAAWQTVALATGEALERAPADPAVNMNHLLALRGRDAALRQVAARVDQSWY